MALRLGELTAFLRADNTHLERGVKAAEQKLRQAGQKARQYAPVIGAAMAAGIGAGLAGAMDLDKARAKLSAQIGDPALAAQLGKVAGQVYGQGFGESAAAAMDAVRAVAQANLVPSGDSAALQDLTIKAQAYADVWGTDVASAVSTASTLVKSGIARDGTHALDLLTAASRKVPTAMVGDIQEVGAEYGQFFRSLGFSGEQAFALLAQGADKGTWGMDKTGDAIKEFSILATELDGAPADALKSLGLNARNMQNDLLAGGDRARGAFEKTVAALLGVKDPAKQAQLALDLFGTPLEDLNKADIPAFLQSLHGVGDGLGDVSGAAQGAADDLGGSASQKLSQFGRQIQMALVTRLADAIPMIEATFGWLSKNSGWVGPLATGLGVLAGAIAVIVGVMKVWAVVQTVLNLALWTSPITWIVVGVLALVAGIIYLATQTQFFQTVWSAVWTAGKAVVEWAINWIVGGWSWLIGLLVDGAKAWWSLFSGTWRKVGNLGRDALQWIIDKAIAFSAYMTALPGRIRGKLRSMFDPLKSGFKNAINWIIGRWNNLSFTIGGGSVMGVGIPSVTLNTPNLPMLAAGGHILGSGMAIVGEAGPELVHLGRGATVQPLAGEAAPAGEQRLRLTGEFRVRGRDLILLLRNQAQMTSGGIVKLLDG
ncbi:phage tail tape measure protein [Micromonospora sp. LOL_024]|uniref:phage tail tape measure protein n=1 Tax=Micromonospora sp. LOL_024 TaxID=3345412 RepID=UPI003A88EC20